MRVAFTIAAEAANVKAVTIQLSRETYLRSATLDSQRVVKGFLSSDADGLAPVNAATTDIVPTVGTAGELLDPSVTSENKSFDLLTNAAGKIDLVLTNASDEAETVYLNIVDPNTGKVHTSAAIAFADDTP